MYVQAEGSRISSTVGRKIRYRFPSSKLSTRYVWEGRQETPYGQRGTQPASLAYVSYVGWKLWAQPCLNRLARSYDTYARAIAPRYTHREQEREQKQDRRRVGTWRRERESSTLRVPRCGTMRARALLYRKSFMRERSRSTRFGTGNGLNGGWSRLTGPNENVRGKYPLPFFSSPRPFVPLESRKKGGKEERRESLLRNVDKAETGAGRIENLVAASIAGGKSRSFFTLIDTHYPPTDLLWNWSDEFCVFLTGSRYATSD